ncbi:MAG TPA: DinB family protein [Blastocatellia bacterium]|nr:DinB family protein [Blastocatellia bacterium]
MKSLKVSIQLLLVLCVGFICHVSLASEDPNMTAEDRAKVVKLLNDSHKQTLDLLEGLSEEQLKFKPAPEKWSVLEVAEHICLAEGLLFGAVEGALAAKQNPEWETKTKGKTEFLERVMVSRDRKATAPESVVPSGKLTRDQVIAKLKESRAKTSKFAEETKLPLKAHTLDHPFPSFNTLNAYQWLIYIPLHNIRHNKQIEEVKADPNFPKKVKSGS